MGDRSNVNIIKKDIKTGMYVGVNLYFHWGGTEVQKEILDLIAGNGIENGRMRISADSYDIRWILANILKDYTGDYNAGVTPFFAKSIKEATEEVSDNEHDILTILLKDTYNEQEGKIYIKGYYSDLKEFDLDEDGIEYAKAKLELR